MPNKATVASDWLAGCAGCHMSLLDMDERLVTLLEHVSLARHAHHRLETSARQRRGRGHPRRLRQQFRRRARGPADARALQGAGGAGRLRGVWRRADLRNGVCMRDALRRAYIETESTAEGRVPSDPELAVMQDARALDQVVKVDVYLPGCPPSPDTIFHALAELAAGRKPVLTGKNLDWH